MSKLNFFIYFIFIIFFQINILCEEDPTKIQLGFSDTLKLTKENSFNNFFNLEYTEEELTENSILVISSNSEEFLSPGYIYASFDTKNPSPDLRQFSSQLLGKNNLYINSSKLKEHKNLYINVNSLKETSVTFEVSLKTEIIISEETKKITIKPSDVSQIYFKPNNISATKILFYGIGENSKYFSMKVNHISNGEIKEEYECTQMYETGFGVIIDISAIEFSESESIAINIDPEENFKEKKIEIGFDLVDEADNSIIDVNILDHVYGAAQEGENCYQIKNMNLKNATVLFNTFSQYVTFTLKKNETKIYSLDVFNNYFFKYPMEFVEENSYFCFKKFTPKEKEEEELGPISYDFQIYYEDELPNIQSYIMPLINGKVYTHSLNSGDIIIYRHNSFQDDKLNKIYNANLLTIRGKPKMYGYSCKTYPNCNIDESKFEELKKNNELDIIKPFNQYFINKKENALGNIESDPNNDPVSEIREQYLTIIKCETTEYSPNYGECKYTIEINNEIDVIQLAPEVVFATSVISDETKFLIKVTDYESIEYLKIFFTVLTGNAEISLDSIDSQSVYTYRRVHRKQEIKVTNNKQELYYLTVKAIEPSFIEIKYETDFYFRGYTMMNPNEINIEYVNKQNDFMPFEIQNPDYLYPTSDPRNNDFYFTIKSLDCGMTYKYNFVDFVNITSIHHEVKSNDINFGTSYAFMLRVEKYFHTVKDDTEDCAMIIYTGEKSEKTPLLMLSDMAHPSNFSETYYIYPFIYNADFNGIFVDIKFDYELLTKLNESPKVEVTLKIGNQEKDFETNTIKKDYTFYIKKEDAKKYCSSNLQCSLNIEIIKIFDEGETKIPYIIKTNVYNAKKSPEYIFKNKVYNYKLSPVDLKYFYTQIDLNEEGEINFMFNRGNAKIFAKITDKSLIEVTHNWNNKVKLPESTDQNTLLDFDPILGVIKYTKEDTKNCEKGCELYIGIQSEEKTEKETEFTEVSFSINDKLYNDVELRLNNYIKGNLEKETTKYYNILIPEDYLKISINLYSPYGKAKINYINNDNNEDGWELIPSNSFGRIVIDCKDEKIKKETLKRASFTIAISTQDNLPEELNEDYLYYYLEVQGLYNNDKAYYDLTSGRSIICNTENENYCYVLLYLNHYYDNQNNLVYALSNSEGVQINANYYTSEDIEKISFMDSIQDKFPKSNDKDSSSNIEAFKLLDSSKISETKDTYILLTLDAGKKNSLIKLVLSSSNTVSILLPYNTDKLLQLNKNKKEFYIQNKGEYNYILHIKSLKGTSTLSINGEDKEIKGNYYIEFKPNENLAFNINSNDESIILLNYEKNKKNQIYEINNNTEIYLPISGENFPQYTYSKLNKLENNKTNEIVIVFNEIEHTEKNSDDLFDIKAYIINEDELNSLINNPTKEITGEEIIGNYNLTDKTGIIDISTEKSENNNYIYIIIDKNSENKNVYKKIKTNYKIGEKDDEGKKGEDDEKKDDKKKDKKEGKGWIAILIIAIIICVALIIGLLIFKKKRLENVGKTEKEVNNMEAPLNVQ